MAHGRPTASSSYATASNLNFSVGYGHDIDQKQTSVREVNPRYLTLDYIAALILMNLLFSHANNIATDLEGLFPAFYLLII